jgi:hypothetical protein
MMQNCLGSQNKPKHPSIHRWCSHHHKKRGVPNRWLEGNFRQSR